MPITIKLHHFSSIPEHELKLLLKLLHQHKIETRSGDQPNDSGMGVCVLDSESEQSFDQFSLLVKSEDTQWLVCVRGGLRCEAVWRLLSRGAADVLNYDSIHTSTPYLVSRLLRWDAVNQLVKSKHVGEIIVGESGALRRILRQIVEVASFTESSVLILGESGTGKELAARLVHTLDAREDKGGFVVLDCSTITPDLSGSEFFGHERGAFTGAVAARDGAFALADRGTLFLDEVGELPLYLQAQLLRVIQEQTYKRVGGNVWQRTRFRLVCATNRDLWEQVQKGEFRADLYYRIAGFVCRLPPLRQRPEDILLLARHFFQAGLPGKEPPELDVAVMDYLLRRDYPGNVRDLKQMVARMLCRYAGAGPITAGCLPPEDRPQNQNDWLDWGDAGFDRAIRVALNRGEGLKAISRASEDAAIRIAVEEAGGNLQRAAMKLGVTDRALQLRRVAQRQRELN